MDYPQFSGIILRHGSHILLIQRGEHAKYWPLYWGFPGGKKETHETLFEAAKRELLEEVGVSIEEQECISSIHILAHYSDGDRENMLYLFDNYAGMPENLEPKIHHTIGWHDINHLPYPMIPHVQEGLKALLRGEERLEYNGI